MTHLQKTVLQSCVCTLFIGQFGKIGKLQEFLAFATDTDFIVGFFTHALPYDNEYGPDYGTDWIMVLDNDGRTNVVNYSSLPMDERGFLFGDAYFRLYTRYNDVAETLEVPDKNGTKMNSRYFNSSNAIIFITHGWLGMESTGWLQEMKDELLKNSDYNIINVDWSELAENPIYPWAALSTRYVGKRIAKMLIALGQTYQIINNYIHLIGHSLGAHVMGYAGMFYHSQDSQVDRITGLDPARPMFEIPEVGKDFRLDKADAGFVDVIHTCGGIYGYLHSFGHADFYPNDGRARQPGCEGVQPVIEGCSHGRSVEFFGESINSKTGFVSYPCESWDNFEKGECKDNSTLMGFPASPDKQGDFYLYTRSEPEYAEG